MKLLVIRDESSKILGHRYLNSQISLYLGLLQLAICIWAVAQHFFSLFRYNKILFCDFINGTEPVLLVGVDIIIFDIGLFHSLWGIDSCVAQHLDGGYGRCMWCICHILAFVICLPFAFVSRPRPYSLWPLLIQQSAYGVGLLILSLAALPRVLPTFTGDQNSASLFSVSIYAAGASLNFFLLYIYWHWYWHVEAMWNTARKLRLDHSNSSMVNQQRSHEPSLKSASITDSIPLRDVQSQNSFYQIQRITPSKLQTEMRDEQVTTIVSENLHEAENSVNYNYRNYHHLRIANKCQKSCEKYNNVHMTDCDERKGLLQAISQERVKCSDKLTGKRNLSSNGYLQCKMESQQPALCSVWRQKKSLGLEPFYFLAHYSPPMNIAWRSCRPFAQSTKLLRNLNVSQESPLIDQSLNSVTPSSTLLTNSSLQ
uniref:G_PROTEIN_RECEP_F1_2 domain-containing protein n=1 Tax=Elaeophora elaphi TaxID=1147741 RepID=A0A0R3S501_9BILA